MEFPVPTFALLIRRMDESRGGGGMGCFLVLVIIGIVVFLVLRGRQDRAEQLGAAKRPMETGHVAGQLFPNPYPKCPSCGASGDKMRQAWDGLRKVTWTCGYCGGVAGVQELKDEELPPGARARLGLDAPADFQAQGLGGPGYYPPQQGGGMGGIVTGMILGSMLGGGHQRRPDDWSGGSGDWGSGGGAAGGGADWGEGDASGGGFGGDSGGDSGGDWGDSGGGDSGGSDF
jgi:hypothetical protein